MKDFWLKTAHTLVAAAVVANATLLWQLNERLTRIEARIGVVTRLAEPSADLSRVALTR